MHKKSSMALLLPLLIAFLIATPATAYTGAWSTYASPTRIQEGKTTQIHVRVTGGNASAAYTVKVYVTDSSGWSTYWVSWVINTNASGNADDYKTYPTDFSGGAHTNYVGIYPIRVDITAPAGEVASGVATGYFIVGLTDKTSYQRTETVGYQASGFGNGEGVWVNILDWTGASVTGYPKLTAANGTGYVTGTWKIPKDQPIGTHTITFSGASTIKPILDSQVFLVSKAVLTIVDFTTCDVDGNLKILFDRTETVYAKFKVVYPDGSEYKLGTWGVQIKNPAGTVVTTLSASYSTTLGAFFTTTGYTIPIDATIATTWSAVIKAQSIADAYDNRGPAADAIAWFEVKPAELKITIYMDGVWVEWEEGGKAVSYQRTWTIKQIAAEVKYPDGTPMTKGFVIEVRLYDANEGVNRHWGSMFWNGSMWIDQVYKIPRDVPTGTWYIVVHAIDIYLNEGTDDTSFTVIPAVFNIVVTTDKFGYAPGETIKITAYITYPDKDTVPPDGTVLTQALVGPWYGWGYVTAYLYNEWGTYMGEVDLTFNVATSKWEGSIVKVDRSAMDFGIWKVEVEAQDSWEHRPDAPLWRPWKQEPNEGTGHTHIGNGVVKDVAPKIVINQWEIDMWPAGPQGTNFTITVVVYSGAGKVGAVWFRVTTPETKTKYWVNMTAYAYAKGADLYYVAIFPTDFPAGANTLELGRYLVEVTVYFTADYWIFGVGKPYKITPDEPWYHPNAFDVFVKISGTFKTQATQYLPGDRVTFDILVTDARGIPVGKLYAKGYEWYYDWQGEELPEEPWWFQGFRLTSYMLSGKYLTGGLTGALGTEYPGRWWPSVKTGTYETFMGLPAAGVVWHFGFLNYPMGIRSTDGTWIWCPWTTSDLGSGYPQNYMPQTSYAIWFSVWPTFYNGTVPKEDQMKQLYSSNIEWFNVPYYGSYYRPVHLLSMYPIEIPSDAKPGVYTYDTYIAYGEAIYGYGLPPIFYYPFMGAKDNGVVKGWDFPNADVVGKHVTGTFEVLSRISLNYILEKMYEIKAQIVDVIKDVNGTLYAKIDTTAGNVLAKLTDINATLTGLVTNSKGEILAAINTALGTVEVKLDALNATIVDIKSKVATISTSIGDVKIKLDALNATLVSVKGDIALIKTNVGTISTKIGTLNATLVSIAGDVATVKTNVGTITGTVTAIQGDVATIKTDVGTIKTNVASALTAATDAKTAATGAKSAVDAMSTPLYLAVVLALVAAIAAIASVIQISRKIAG